MAQLNDTMVQGDLRVTGKIYGTDNAIHLENANLAIPMFGAGDYVGSSGDFFIGSGSGKNLPDTTNNFNIHTTVAHFSGTTYRLSQIATPTSSTNPTGIYERGGMSTDGITWTFGGWLAVANSNHAHGNIANGGTLTDTAAAAAGNDYVVIRDADNSKIQTSTIKGTDVADAVSKKHSHSTLTLSTTAQAYDGSHKLALPSTDPYTSARTPASHASSATTYGVGTTSNYGHVKLATGDMNGATHSDGVAVSKNHIHSQYLTSHQDISGKMNANGSNAVAPSDGDGATATLLNNLTSTGLDNITSDNVCIPTTNSSGSDTSKWYKRPLSYLWPWIKSKLTGSDVNIGGSAARATYGSNVNLDSQSVSLLTKVKELGQSNLHYARFFTSGDGGAANITDRPVTGSEGFVCEAIVCRRASSSDYCYQLIYWRRGINTPYYATITNTSTSISWVQGITSSDGYGSNIAMGSGSGNTLGRALNYKVSGYVDTTQTSLKLIIADSVGSEDNAIYLT